MSDYNDGRNHPARDATSRLSAHLHFGEISPRAVWQHASTRTNSRRVPPQMNKFLSELGWREFSPITCCITFRSVQRTIPEGVQSLFGWAMQWR